MKNNELKELEAMLANFKNDSHIAAENFELTEIEQQTLLEVEGNERKMELLLENPSEENVQAVLDYFENINNLILH